MNKAIPQGQNGHLDKSQEDWLQLMPDGWDGTDIVARNAELEKLVKAFDWCTENLDVPYGYDAFDCDRCPLKQSNSITPECEVMMDKLGIRRSNGL